MHRIVLNAYFSLDLDRPRFHYCSGYWVTALRAGFCLTGFELRRGDTWTLSSVISPCSEPAVVEPVDIGLFGFRSGADDVIFGCLIGLGHVSPSACRATLNLW